MKNIIKFLNGDISLGNTFFWGLVITIILSPILYGMAKSFQLEGATHNLFSYLPFILWYVAIWRSAGKHKGKKIWSYQARIFVAVNLFFVVYNMI